MLQRMATSSGCFHNCLLLLPGAQIFKEKNPKIYSHIFPSLTANLRIGIYNGEMVFNGLIGNGWWELDDLFGRPQ